MPSGDTARPWTPFGTTIRLVIRRDAVSITPIQGVFLLEVYARAPSGVRATQWLRPPVGTCATTRRARGSTTITPSFSSTVTHSIPCGSSCTPCGARKAPRSMRPSSRMDRMDTIAISWFGLGLSPKIPAP